MKEIIFSLFFMCQLLNTTGLTLYGLHLLIPPFKFALCDILPVLKFGNDVVQAQQNNTHDPKERLCIVVLMLLTAESVHE